MSKGMMYSNSMLGHTFDIPHLVHAYSLGARTKVFLFFSILIV